MFLSHGINNVWDYCTLLEKTGKMPTKFYQLMQIRFKNGAVTEHQLSNSCHFNSLVPNIRCSCHVMWCLKCWTSGIGDGHSWPHF